MTALSAADTRWCIVPAVLMGVAYEVFLGPRHDYTGHFAAGYAGSLGAMAVWLRTLSPEQFGHWSVRGLAPVCIACILIGTFMEATAFRLAKFDEIDLCNQSLGAVLAALVALRLTGDVKRPEREFDEVVVISVILFGIGCFFAVA